MSNPLRPWTVALQAPLSFTISLSLLKFMSIESVMPSSHLTLCCPLLLLPSLFTVSGTFQRSQFFASGGQSTGTSASASVLSKNIQGSFSLGLTHLISLLSKGFSRVFPAPQLEGINSLALSLLYDPTLIFVHDY